MQPINPHVEMRRVDPVEVGHDKPEKSIPQDPLEGKTVYEAIHITANMGDDLKITNLKGKFQKDLTNQDVIIADSFEVDGKKYFKFIVDWEVEINGQIDPVRFSQSVFTNVEIPMKGSIQDLEYAEKKAYQLAKSYELIQKNIVKRPPDIKDEVYKQQVDILKTENQISFSKDESIKSKHQFSMLKAESNSIPLYLSKEKTNKASKEVFSRLDLIPKQKIILREGSGINLADFQNKEMRGIKASSHDKEYQKHLEEQAKGYKDRFDKHVQVSDVQKNKISNIRKTDQFKKAKADYLKLSPQDETQKNIEIASLYKKSGLTDLQNTLEEMKKEHKIHENANSLIHNTLTVSTKPIIEVDADGQILKDQIKDLENTIEGLKLDILDPAKDSIISAAQANINPVVEQQSAVKQGSGVEIEIEEVKAEESSPKVVEQQSTVKKDSSVEIEIEEVEAEESSDEKSQLQSVLGSKDESFEEGAVLNKKEANKWHNDEKIESLKRTEITINGKAIPKNSESYLIYNDFLRSITLIRARMKAGNEEILEHIINDVEDALNTHIIWFDHLKKEKIDKNDLENDQFFEEYKASFEKEVKESKDKDPKLHDKFKEVLVLIETKRNNYEKYIQAGSEDEFSDLSFSDEDNFGSVSGEV